MDLVALVYFNWGRWVADCPRQGCSSAEHCGPDPVTGHIGGLTDVAFRCGHCRWEGAARWPQDKDVIEALLNARPVPSTRNWRPGEPLDHLVTENIAHDVYEVERA